MEIAGNMFAGKPQSRIFRKRPESFSGFNKKLPNRKSCTTNSSGDYHKDFHSENITIGVRRKNKREDYELFIERYDEQIAEKRVSVFT